MIAFEFLHVNRVSAILPANICAREYIYIVAISDPQYTECSNLTEAR